QRGISLLARSVLVRGLLDGFVALGLHLLFRLRLSLPPGL
ncbi:unnamed protein product, partial [marine sediment metagenome]